MAELLNSKRIIFPKGKQKLFLIRTQKILNISWLELAKLLNVSNRTLSDWKREKFSMTLNAARFILKKAKIKIPSYAKIKDPFWYVDKGARLGGLALYKKYGKVGGDEKYRKDKWYEWWEKKGRFIDNEIIKRKPIKKPRKTIEFAEFIGIMLGDGGMTQGQITITLNRKDDRDYILYVIALIKKLFDAEVYVWDRKKYSVNNIVISRTELVDYCKSMGLKVGNKIKQKADIPNWIKRDTELMKACVRGLIDTDGSIFKHCYKIKNKEYCYKKLDFTSRSLPLLLSVHNFLKKSGFTPRITYDKNSIRLDNQKEVGRYFLLIGTKNLKHLKRYNS